jgi:Helix-turn-helix domain
VSENFLSAQFVSEPGEALKVVKSFNLFIGSAWRNCGLDPYETAVLVNLVSRMDQKGECYPSALTLAEECMMSRSTVFIALRGLRDKGFIDWRSREVDHGNNVFVILGHPDLRVSQPNGSSPPHGLLSPEVVRHTDWGSPPHGLLVVRHTDSKVNPEGEPKKVNPNIAKKAFSLSDDLGANKRRPKQERRASSLEEVVAYGETKGLPRSDCVWFWNHCEADDWTNGKSNRPIHNWKATLMSWFHAGYILPSHRNGAALNGKRS